MTQNHTHYIAMAGLHGYLPNVCDVYGDYQSAVDSMVDLLELGKRRARELKRNRYLELNLRRDRNEYVEISECTCDEPIFHSDGGQIDF